MVNGSLKTTLLINQSNGTLIWMFVFVFVVHLKCRIPEDWSPWAPATRRAARDPTQTARALPRSCQNVQGAARWRLKYISQQSFFCFALLFFFNSDVYLTVHWSSSKTCWLAAGELDPIQSEELPRWRSLWYTCLRKPGAPSLSERHGGGGAQLGGETSARIHRECRKTPHLQRKTSW